ncbi:response regulator transcription factor [Rhizobium sp. CG4]|uniref:response regulator transcription factor n=1 Tax=unclassified Rhizobium TaxID=2613769 RepID=UPI002034664B|nr:MULTISPECIES: response regulator [unclassified Rhizobium]MCM2458203.1 response regulator transcription factor [Rhizobium sp. CG4]MCS4243121.1 FixJ family two-component response regulator [Rhizobium sp. BIGb0125]
MLNGSEMHDMVPLITIVDDEEPIRRSLVDLFGSFDMHAVAFDGAIEFFAGFNPERPGCILLDVNMPDLSGLELQHRLFEMGCSHPVMFITGFEDVKISVDAMKAGATDFFLKPFDSDIMIAAAIKAIDLYGERRTDRLNLKLANRCFEKLTPRERQVLKYVTDGLLNKQIAWELRISEIMVKLHRGRMMKKMECRTLSELVRRYDLLGAADPTVLNQHN